MGFTEEQLKDLAQQLSKPNGEQGINVANMMHDTNIGMTNSTIKALNIADTDRVLELGHGNCKHLSEILNKAENTSYVGLEISELMQKEAIQYNTPAILENKASFHLYDGNKIPFDDNTFDKILTVNTIYFWKNPKAFIKEIYRVIKPEGSLAISFADKNFMETLPFTAYGFNLYSKEQASHLAEIAGFSMISINSYTEIVKSKAGDEVERIFHMAIAKK